jgi:hypothetical protein
MRSRLIPFLAAMLLLVVPAAAAGLNISQMMSLRQACGSDIKALCAGIDRGKGRIAQCMMAHADAVSPKCAAALKAAKAKFPALTMGSSLYDTD